jgi:hypothetical protein
MSKKNNGLAPLQLSESGLLVSTNQKQGDLPNDESDC